MVKVTNTGTAPRGVYVNGVLKFIGPGQTKELVLTGRELAEAKGVECLIVEAPEVAKPKAKAPKVDAVAAPATIPAEDLAAN